MGAIDDSVRERNREGLSGVSEFVESGLIDYELIARFDIEPRTLCYESFIYYASPMKKDVPHLTHFDEKSMILLGQFELKTDSAEHFDCSHQRIRVI